MAVGQSLVTVKTGTWREEVSSDLFTLTQAFKFSWWTEEAVLFFPILWPIGNQALALAL